MEYFIVTATLVLKAMLRLSPFCRSELTQDLAAPHLPLVTVWVEKRIEELACCLSINVHRDCSYAAK